MASNATVTAKTSIGTTVTSKSITNITAIRFDLVRQMIYITKDGQDQEFDISANNTCTLTYSSGNYTLTIS